jgi:hypothetical protein
MAPLAVMLLLAVILSPAGGIFVGGVVVDGWVMGPGDARLEGARVEVVGMDEFNSTTDEDGYYSMQVPFLEVGHTLSFKHPDLQSRQVSTGPLVEDGWVTVNATLMDKAPWATFVIRILPWEQMGTGYGLRQEEMSVVNMEGTAPFEWSEVSTEEEVSVPAPGSYMVTATRPGYYPITEVVTVGRGDRVVVDLDMTGHKKPTYGWVNGSVEDDGYIMPFVTVVAQPVNGSRTYQAVTGTDGNFSMQLPNGTFMVFVEAEGYAKLSQGVEVVLGDEVDLHFKMTEAENTGNNGNPILFWSGIIAVVVVLGSIIAYATATRRRTEAEEAAKAALKEELRCPACDELASPDADSCATCGGAFPWKSFRCPDCGAVMGLDETRCPECGNQTFDLHRG